MAPADASDEPQRFMSRAISPTVVRTATTPPPREARTLTLPASDVAVTLSAAPNPVRVGQDLTYTVTVSNRGPAAAMRVAIDFPLSTGATFGAVGSISPIDVPHGCSVQEDYVSCTVEGLSPRETWTMQFTVRPTADGRLRQEVTAGGAQPDPAPGNNSATVETRVMARESAVP